MPKPKSPAPLLATRHKDKEAKVTTAQTLWIPAVNNCGEFARWSFLEIRDPWDAAKSIRQLVEKNTQTGSKPGLQRWAFT